MDTATNKPKEAIVIRSDDVQEIMATMPRWMERRGITMVAGMVILLIVMSAFIHYPDVISGRMTLQSQLGPARITAKAAGRIEQLLVTDRQPVKAGTLLILIANTARYEDICRLETIFAKTDSPGQSPVPPQVPNGLQLGDVQPAYATFLQYFREYHYVAHRPATGLKNSNISSQLADAVQMQGAINQKKKILADELALEKTALERQQQLYTESVISKSELELQQKIFLQKQKEYQAILNEAISGSMQQGQLRGQIIGNTTQQQDNANDRYTRLLESISLLRQAVVDWKARYLITAPMEGVVSFTRGWSINQTVNAQEEVLTIVPGQGAGDIVGRLRIAPAGAGKLAPGQVVNIHLDNYPSNEFGLLKGKVKAIAPVPENGLYNVEVSIDPLLVTTYQKKITFAQELGGMANVITTDRTILQRIFHNLNKTWEH